MRAKLRVLCLLIVAVALVAGHNSGVSAQYKDPQYVAFEFLRGFYGGNPEAVGATVLDFVEVYMSEAEGPRRVMTRSEIMDAVYGHTKDFWVSWSYEGVSTSYSGDGSATVSGRLERYFNYRSLPWGNKTAGTSATDFRRTFAMVLTDDGIWAISAISDYTY